MSGEDLDRKYRSELAALLGREGGKARAKKLSPEQRKQIAKDAANWRWHKDNPYYDPFEKPRRR